MKSARKWLITLAILFLASGVYWYFDNHLSKDQIAKTVSAALQQKLETSDLAEYQMKVLKVEVLHETGNKYAGIATVDLRGKQHQVPLSIIADGKSVAWQAEQGAFLFAAQESIQQTIQQAMQRASADMERAAADASAAVARAEVALDMPSDVLVLTEKYGDLNRQCRSGHGDEPSTQAACADRDATYSEIRAKGWCWGHRSDISADRTWVPCAPGDA
ncbi:hypothetical protein [Pandoraea terrigena]|uniref:Uncharacterized protein n=1 Tax=Pandoraea terrigena TaxID=2508292 RepID=A0A5E4V7F2_9BURK|nr:hypothetical protein [Pandoraea terrigena]VVE06955.1 hypothetical protein PTE31013_02439 [Pandoraea terrigena]